MLEGKNRKSRGLVKSPTEFHQKRKALSEKALDETLKGGWPSS
jgi:hypothetical protein